MGCTERRVLALVSIAFLLALTVVGAAAAPAASDGVSRPSEYPSASPAAFAERAAQTQSGGPRAAGSFGHAVELMVLVATCGIVVALYSAMDAGRGGKRVLMRTHRR